MLPALPLLILLSAVGQPVQPSDPVHDDLVTALREDFSFAPSAGSPEHVEAVLESAVQELPPMVIVSSYNYMELADAVERGSIPEPTDLGYVFHTSTRGTQGGEITTGVWPEIEKRYLEATNGYMRTVKFTVFRYEW